MVGAADRAKRVARTSVWLSDTARRVRAPRRGAAGAVGLDRERITVAAVRLLDAEGPAGFSMRRLAAELNVTAMSVYWYVDTKDELLELALDAVFGELELPDAESEEGWRDQLRGLATGYRGLLVRHPWVPGLIGNLLNIGPSSMAFSACVRQVIWKTGMPPDGRTGAMSAVLQFVYGAHVGGAETRERDFEFALELLIAGIETKVPPA
ncbi:TetR/AcrR family transcriptional regulator C-terminal domain-containing protein [Streptomyces sp. NPDC051920]|uniref:TetR/AcrR family transcriptional regulator n=1 Tax=Streptomyces sp. NPDC051920 TaxID=3155523 RepID=UPI00343869E1